MMWHGTEVVWAGAGMSTAEIHTFHLARSVADGVLSASPATTAPFCLELPASSSKKDEPGAGRPLPLLRWIAPHPLYTRLYVAVSGGSADGCIYAVEADSAGIPVRTLGQGQSTKGTGPCHISVIDRFVLVAHYAGGSISVLPILSDGSVGPVVCLRHHGPTGAGKHARQEAPHPHQIILSSDERFVFVCDLGLNAVVVCERR